MSRLDIRWLLHHPVRWVRAVGFQLTVAALLVAKAVLVTDPLWDITAWAHLGPIVLAVAGGMAFASAVAPADHRLQVATMLTLIGLAAWRIAVYGLLAAADISPNTAVLSQAFMLHWLFIGAVATRWPILSTKSALIVTVEAGRDQEPLRAAS